MLFCEIKRAQAFEVTEYEAEIKGKEKEQIRFKKKKEEKILKQIFYLSYSLSTSVHGKMNV